MDTHTLLGEAAESLLEHECKTFERESLTPNSTSRGHSHPERRPNTPRTLP